MKKSAFLFLVVLSIAIGLLFAQNQVLFRYISLPTSKQLIGPMPGRLGSLNGFTPTIALSPDRHYAALLNDGYGSQEAKAHQSVAILDLTTNKLTDFPEERLSDESHQTYFLGLAFSSDGAHLYASMASLTDPNGERKGNTGNGIAVYSFQLGKVAWERFIKIPPQKVATDKKVAYAVRTPDPNSIPAYPAGLAVINHKRGDRLLIADNYADNVILLDSRSGEVLKTFDLSRHSMIPAEFPYSVVATRDGHHAWVSLWNASTVAELDLKKNEIKRWIPTLPPADPLAPGSHPTALLLNPDEKLLYVALANADRVIALTTSDARQVGNFDASIAGQKFGGSYPNALALSSDGTWLFVADASLNAVAVFGVSQIGHRPLTILPVDSALGFIPTDWYPTALAIIDNDLLIATSKGQGTTPNTSSGGTSCERRHHEHPYIPTLLYGSLAPQLPSD